MQETAPIAPAVNEVPVPSPTSSTSFRRMVAWGGRWVRAALAAPRYLIRHPARTLAITGLLLLIGVGAAVTGVSLWASYHLRLARAALERYHNREAAIHLQDTLSVWPRDPETLLLAARASRRAARRDAADQYLDRYQEVRGNDDENLILERVLVRVERGELDSVSKFCQTLIARDDPAVPLILEALCRGYLRSYRPREAEQTLHEWFQRQPDNPQALLIQGQIDDLETRSHDAVIAYRRALTVDPELDEARLRLCSTLMQLGLAEESLPHLEYLSRRFPDNLMVQVHLASAHDRLGHTKKAEKLIEEVLARRPQFAPALTECGKLALRAGRIDEAEKWLRQAVALEPGDHLAHYQLFLCLERSGKSEEARKEQNRLKEIEDDIKRIQEIAHGKMEADPHNANIHYEVGMIAMRAGSIEESLRWLQSALHENPHHTAAHKALMEYYQRIGDFGRARQHRQKVRE